MNHELRELEERLLQPEFRRNRAAVSALLADDFVEFGSSGRVYEKPTVLDLLQTEELYPVVLSDFRTVLLTPETALVLYRTIRPEGPPEPGAVFLRSSVWVRRSGRWQMLFHQGTLAAAPASS